MTTVIYRPVADDGCSPTTTQFGYSFTAGLPVDVTDGFALGKFAGHPHFEVREEVAQGAPADPPMPPRDLVAKHIGAGKYAVLRNGERVKDGLSKADAEAFNDLSDEDQQAFIA